MSRRRGSDTLEEHWPRHKLSRKGQRRRERTILTIYLTSVITSKENIMDQWQVQDAKARFSEFLEASLKKGPKIVTRRGVEAAVLLPVEEWRRLQRAARPGLKELLLSDESRFEDVAPTRGAQHRRPVPRFK